jgi:xanthine dehydrogenase small subunit
VVVNGQTRELGAVGGHVTLLDWLRGSGLTGCKEGCAEGECGACAVLVARDDGPDRARWVAINACLVPAAAFDQQEVVTAEGLGRLGGPGRLHPVQREMAERGGSQCGYCTPGFICSMAAEYYRRDRTARPPATPAPGGAGNGSGTPVTGRKGIGPNGAGFLAPANGGRDPDSGRGAGGTARADGGRDPDDGRGGTARADGGRDPDDGRGGTARADGGRDPDDGRGAGGTGAADEEHGANGFDLHALSGNLCRCTGYRPIRDAAYALGQPEAGDPFLTRLAEPAPPAAVTVTSNEQGRYVRPGSLAEALGLLAAEPQARLVAGSTDWGVELNIRHARAALTIGIERIAELREFAVGPDYIDIGAALSLSEIEARLAGRVPLLAQMFPQFASRLIRNGATLGGNLGTASPIGDAPPALLALDARLVLASAEGERDVPLNGYFTGYRQSVRRPGELIKTIRIPLPVAPVTAFHKIAKRRFDDISGVAVAYALRPGPEGTVASIQIGLGGVAATPLRAQAAEAALTGRPWARDTVAAAAEEMARAGTPMSDHRASEAYRIAMLRNSLLKFFTETLEEARS